MHLKLTSLQYLKDTNYCGYKWLWHKLLQFLSKIAISNVAKWELLAWIAIINVAKPAKICQKAILYFTKCKSVKVFFNIDTAERWFFPPFCFLLDKHCISSNRCFDGQYESCDYGTNNVLHQLSSLMLFWGSSESHALPLVLSFTPFCSVNVCASTTLMTEIDVQEETWKR